jgi:DNA-binding NarL/FixJ family response regulator
MESALSNAPGPRLLIADDHLIFAEALKSYLEPKHAVVGVVADGRAMVEAVRTLSPDVIILDVAMPVLNGLDAARTIHDERPEIKFVFLTMHDDANLAAAALELGPIGFVLKHSTGPELLIAIEQVLDGNAYLTPRLRPTDWVEARERARQYSQELTPRQRQFVQLFAEGKSIKEIAAIVNLSRKTVEFHKHRIMKSRNLRNKPELTLLAVKLGLIHAEVGPPAVGQPGKKLAKIQNVPVSRNVGRRRV